MFNDYVTNLRVFQMGRAIVRDIYALTDRGFDCSLREQMRAAAVSIVSNIAEGAKRRTNKEFVQFLAIARGSCAELRAQVGIATDCRLIASEDLDDRLDHLSRMLTRLMAAIRRSGP